jgi:hypothetical protein
MDINVIFDNGGGVTLQLGSWAHWYNAAEMAQAARDLMVYEASGDTSDWEGHEPEAAELDPTYDQIRNGGYRVYHTADDIKAAAQDTSWGNIRDFAAAL